MRYSTFGKPRYNTNNSNNNTSYPTGILKKSPPRQGERRERTTSGGEDADQAEARNDEVIRRVAEMKQILDAAEEYLEDDGEATDAESVVTQKSGTESELSSNYGKLKHSDSLLLLTQVGILWSLFCGRAAPNLVRIKKQSRDSHIVSSLQSHWIFSRQTSLNSIFPAASSSLGATCIFFS